MWKKKRHLYGKNENYSVVRKLKKEKKINEEFEIMLNGLTIEEILAIKLELAAKMINFKLYGFPIWNSIPDIIKESTLKSALSITRTKGEAARLLGLNKSTFKALVRKYQIDSYFSENA
tara:strand:+ start:299 stop:655 length:357 start_codon:yes stop_codon:yes gene_type:complete